MKPRKMNPLARLAGDAEAAASPPAAGFPAVPAMVPATSPDAASPGQSAEPAKPNDDDDDDDDEDAPPADASGAFDFRRGCDGALIDVAFTQASQSLSSVQPPPAVNRPIPRPARYRELTGTVTARPWPTGRPWWPQRPLAAAAVFRRYDARPDRRRNSRTQCVCTEACGFCTFHDVANARSRRSMRDAVIVRSIATRRRSAGRTAPACNLSGRRHGQPLRAREIAQIVQALAEASSSTTRAKPGGHPHLFERLLSSLYLRNLAKQPTASKRISIGITDLRSLALPCA